MDLLRRDRLPRIAYFLLPVLVSLTGLRLSLWLSMALVLLTLLALTRVMPFCRGRESLWAFVGGFLPWSVLSLLILLRTIRIGLLTAAAETRMEALLWGMLLFLTVFSAQQLITAVVTRLLWRIQEEEDGDE